MQTIVIGHKNPDMDSICSALAYADLKRAIGVENVIAGRAGNTNARIDYVLNKFGVEAPTFFSDVSPKVRDVMEENVITVRDESTIAKAIGSIEQKRLRGIPVVDAEGRCMGFLSAFKVSHHLFPSPERLTTARRVRGSLPAIIDCFSGVVVAGEPPVEIEEHVLMVGAMSSESLGERFDLYAAEKVVLIVGDRTDIQRLALEAGIKAIVITGGKKACPELLENAAGAGVTIAESPHDTATTVLLARGGVPVREMLETKFTSFLADTSLDLARNKAAASPFFVFPIVDEENRLTGILSKSDFLKPIPRRLILVDHNELNQAVSGASRIPIVEILDHHRLAAFSTEVPILFWNNPVGSTSTIVGLCYQQNGVPIPREIAGLLMAGLISDTLNLTSPTATETDRRLLSQLSEITGILPSDLASEIFSVGSPLLTLSSADAVGADCKDYDEDGVTFSVSQIEELSLERFHENQERLLEALEQHRDRGDYLFCALLVTDINTQNSMLLVRGHEAVIRVIDYPQTQANVWLLEGVVSRKKQLLPYLLHCLHQVDKTQLQP